jgi:flagellar biosynthesis protein FlhG
MTRSLLFTSGKGGVGTSNLVLNLAIALAEIDQRVLVIDGDLGLANLDLLCALSPRHDLGDVLAGRCTLRDAMVSGPNCVQIVAGAHALRAGADLLEDAPALLADELGELDEEADFVLVDAGSGLGPRLAMLAAVAVEAVVVSTPEPTSIADAHAAIARLQGLDTSPRLRVFINQASSAYEAAEVLDRLVVSSRQFLGASVSPLGCGFVRADSRVRLAVNSRRPFVTAYPSATASREVRRLARSLVQESRSQDFHPRHGTFSALVARWVQRLRAKA